MRGVSSGLNSHGARSTGVGSQDACVDSAASSHTRGKMAVWGLDGGKEQGKGREERRQNVAVECRFKYITKDWKGASLSNGESVGSHTKPIPGYFFSTSTQRGLCRKVLLLREAYSQNIWASVLLQLTAGWGIPGWGILNKPCLWKVPGKGSRFGSGRYPWISVTGPGVGCGASEGRSQRSQGPPGLGAPIS